MVITEVRIKLCDNDPVRAIASITFDNEFVVKGIRVLYVNERFIVCMPSRPRKDGKHIDVAHPINAPTRERLNKAIMDAYFDELERPDRGDAPVNTPDDDLDPTAGTYLQ